MTPATPILQVDALRKVFRSGRGMSGGGARTVAVDDVSFSMTRGETFGLVGESGSGKSTVARMVCRFLQPDDGTIRFDGHDVPSLRGGDLLGFRRRVQMVFQDPFASLDPRWKVGRLIEEGMRVHRLVEKRRYADRTAELLEQVGLQARDARRYPHEFSGGQRQRIGIARALAVQPDLLVLDEPVSALDVSVQAQILTLLSDLQQELHLTYLFIAHDLAIVERFCDRIAVMQHGRVVEEGTPDQIYRNPRDAYTSALLDAIPVPDPRQREELVLDTARERN